MDDCNWPNCGCPKLTVEPWCKATVHPSIKLIVVQPIPVLDALAMRERAAKACDEFCSECARAIRALPTTFTDDQLLAAAMQLPEVRALIEAARRAAHATTNDGITGRIYTDEAIGLQRALAPFTKGAS